MRNIAINTPTIQLGQLLKKAEIIATGGQAKLFLLDVEVKVNGERETRRGRKLMPGDTVEIPGHEPIRVIRS
ncbi:S4 domain-containing protein YaaA [Planifilum fimeticola]